MDDQNQNPPQAPVALQPTPQAPVQAHTWWTNFLQKLNADLSALWARDKIFLIAFSAIILTIKFRSLVIDLLVRDSKSVYDKTQQQSDELQKEQDAASQSADKLAEDANNAAQPPPSTNDWYKNE